jgi:hypothetical protein
VRYRASPLSDNGHDKDDKMAARMEAIAVHVMAVLGPDNGGQHRRKSSVRFSLFLSPV